MVKRYSNSGLENTPAEDPIFPPSGNADPNPDNGATGSSDSYSLEDEDDELSFDDNNPAAEEDLQNDDASSEDLDNGEDGENSTSKSPAPIRLLFEMMLNPVEGWKKIRRAKYSADETAMRCFYPLSGIAAASCFAELFYTATAEVSQCVINAISVFAAFFFGNFLVLVAQKAFYPKAHKDDPESKFGKEFVMYNLSTLAIFWTLIQLLPMIAPVLAFLPLWTIYLAIRGSRFFRFPEEKANLTITLNCILLLGAPTSIYWLFSLIL